MIQLGILGSTRGSSMLPIVQAIEQKQLDACIKIVISNKSDAVILQRAAQHHVPALSLLPQGLSRDAYDAMVSQVLREHGVQYVLLIGYMRILSAAFVNEWQHKILNVHPSLLPAFAGGMDLEVHRAVIQAGVKETGCTVHFVTEAVDAGPIITQQSCPVLPGDTPELLKARVQQLEGAALIKAIAMLNVLTG